MTNTTIKPVKLNQRHKGFYSWSNGADVMSSGYLSVNVHRNDWGHSEGLKKNEWSLRLFIPGHDQNVKPIVKQDVWTQRMVRNMLAFVAQAWAEVAQEYAHAASSTMKYRLETIVQQAWLDAADIEIELTGQRAEAQRQAFLARFDNAV